MMVVNTCLVQCFIVLLGLVHTASAQNGCALTKRVTIYDAPRKTKDTVVTYANGDLIPLEDICPIKNYCFNVTGDSTTGSVQNGSVLFLDKEPEHNKLYSMKCRDVIIKKCCIMLIFEFSNTYPPYFTTVEYSVTVSELETIGFPVFNIKQNIRDEDKWTDPVQYRYQLYTEPPATNDVFINKNGIITLNKRLDYDKGIRSYTINITIQDFGDDSTDNQFFTANTVLKINVQNKDDEPVKFKRKFYISDVKEKTLKGVVVEIFPQPNVTDLEVGSTETIVYTLLDGTPSDFSDYFQFQPSTRSLVIKKLVKRDAPRNFTATLKAYKQNREGDTFDESYLLINILKGNEFHPSINDTPSAVNITEILPVGSSVVLVQALDKDDDKLIYSMTDSSSMFTIDEKSGLITLKQNIQPNFARFPVTLQVIAKETNTAEKYESNPHTIDVNILDENIHNPVFENTTYKYDIFLTLNTGKNFGKITATDKDKGINGKVTYKMADTTVPFSIDPTSGDLTVSGALETKTYNFAVIGHDGAPDPRSSVVMVTVNVTSINRKPTFSTDTPKTINVVETTVPGTILTTILATDPDGDVLLFQAQSQGDYFEINLSPDKSCHILTLKKWLNETSLKSINVDLTVSDRTESDSTVITVTIIKVNSFVPEFDEIKYTFSVKENVNIGTFVGRVQANDKDGDTVAYTLPVSIYFKIDGVSGNITTKKKFTKPSTYSLAVKASDKDTFGVALVVVDVTDSNNNGPKFEEKLFQTTVPEDKMCYESIYKPQATDADILPENQQNVYSTDHEHFIINNGFLYLKNSSCKNETILEKNLNVIIKVSDKNEKSFTDAMTVEIYFKDINNHIPEFAPVQSVTSLSVNESTPVGSSLYRFTTEDKDITDVNRLTKFSIKDQKPDKDKFRIDPITGVLYLNKPLDYDTPNKDRSIIFKVVAENIVTNVGMATAATNQSSVTFTVVTVDNDDIPLQFDKTIYLKDVDESLPLKTVVLTVIATKATEYSIDNKKLPFAIDSKSGELTLESALDYNTMTSYIFPVEARYKNENSTAMVVITVNNVNEAPTIHEPLEFYIAENLPANSIIGHIFATDPDNDPLTYQLNDQNFSLNSTTGDLYTRVEFDYETMTRPLYQFTFLVTVTDTKLFDNKLVTVIVNNTLDKEPHFAAKQFTVNILEKDFKSNEQVTLVSASNPDNLGSLTYNIYGDSRFEIQNNGQVTINSSYQIQQIKEKFISLMVVADNGKYEDGALLVVEVVKSLKFVQSNYDIFVKQNTTVGTDIFQLSPRLMVDSYVDISKINVTLSNTVVKYNLTCSCIVINQALDKQKYDVTLTIAQNSDSTSTQLVIHVLPVNSHPPEILLQKNVVNVTDDVPPGYVVSNITAKDSDFNSGFTFYLTETYNKFQIDSSNGLLTVAISLNYLQQSSYNLTVFVQDHGSPPLHSQTSLTVNVINSNKFAPNFKTFSANISINENSKSNNIFTVIADDGDSNGVTYAISEGISNQTFQIDGNTGVISVKNSQALDFEVTKKFELNITATDNAKNSRSTSKEMTIYLIDVNDNSPRFQSLSYFARNLPIHPNDKVFEVNAHDIDSARNDYNVITYTQQNHKDLFNTDANKGIVTSKKNLTQSLIYFIDFQACDGGNLCTNYTVQLLTSSNLPLIANVKENVSDAFVLNVNISNRLDVTYYLKTCSNFFTINSKTGILRTKLPLRWDRTQTNLTVVVVEDSPKNSSEITITVIIEDINDHKPEFRQSFYEFNVAENSKQTFVIEATDSDSLLNANITYSLEPFIINNGTIVIDALTGKLTITDLDREEMSNYTLQVVANDNGNPPLQSTAIVSIIVTDENDNAPVFLSPRSRTFPVRENNSPNEIVTIFNATDADSGLNGQVFYKLLNSSLPFSINPTTGELYTTQSLDYETSPMYNVEILAYDLGEPQHTSSTYNITINVIDVCDNQIQLRPTFYVANNMAVNRTMLSFASSASGTNFRLANDQNIFKVDDTSGGLSISSKFPSQPGSYNVTVVAHNQCNVTVEEEITVIVKDFNQQNLQFRQSFYEFNVAENSKQTFVIEATDSDSLLNANITYSLEPFIINNGAIVIDASTGILTITDLDREEMSNHKLQVVANDNGNPPQQTTATVSITVTDQNDNDPVFISPKVRKFFVTENNGPEIVTIFNATDADSGLNGQVFYKLLNSSLPFSINPTTGELYTTHSLDYETSSMYNVEILAYDLGEPQHNSSTYNITINVIDVCDNQIQMRPTFYVADNTAVDHTMLSFASSASGTNFRLANDKNIFKVDDTSGGLSISSRFPSQISSYNVTVVAHNQCNVTVEEEVTIMVYNSPKDTSGSILKIELAEEIISNRSLFNFSSLEEFQGNNVVFLLQNFKDYFLIKDEQLINQKSVDRESQTLMKLFVNVVKSGRVKRSISNSSIIKTLEIDVTIKDSNDNGPLFSADTLYFGIPITSSLFFEVGKIQAVDKDVGENSISIYSLTGQDKNKFFINPTTATLHTLFVPAAVTQKEYTVTVVAVDKEDPTKDDTVSVMMSIYSTEFSIILTVNSTVDKVRENIDELIRNMSKILAIQIVVDHIQVHVDDTKHPDVNRSDILFHAIDNESKKIISKEDLERKLKDKEKEIFNLLKRLRLNMDTFKEIESTPINMDKSTSFDRSLIVVIILAVIVLIMACSTIILFIVISKRYKKKFDDLQTLLFPQNVDNPTYEKEDMTTTNLERNSNNSSGHVSGSSYGTDISMYESVPFREEQTTPEMQETSFKSPSISLEDQPIPTETQQTRLENQHGVYDNKPPHIYLDVDQLVRESETDDISKIPETSEDLDDPDYSDNVCYNFDDSNKKVTFLNDDDPEVPPEEEAEAEEEGEEEEEAEDGDEEEGEEEEEAEDGDEEEGVYGNVLDEELDQDTDL